MMLNPVSYQHIDAGTKWTSFCKPIQMHFREYKRYLNPVNIAESIKR